MERIFSNFKGRSHFTQIDLASDIHQITVTEKDRPNTALRDADGQLHEFNHARFGLTALSAAFTYVVQSFSTTTRGGREMDRRHLDSKP